MPNTPGGNMINSSNRQQFHFVQKYISTLSIFSILVNELLSPALISAWPCLRIYVSLWLIDSLTSIFWKQYKITVFIFFGFSFHLPFSFFIFSMARWLFFFLMTYSFLLFYLLNFWTNFAKILKKTLGYVIVVTKHITFEYAGSSINVQSLVHMQCSNHIATRIYH